jgi:tRNA (guanine-N7-)-methyltransferase
VGRYLVAVKQTELSSAFFGRRKGKPLRDRQASLLVHLLPKIRPSAKIDLDEKKGDIWLEIGFGSGEHLVSLATCFPDIRFIGCEPFVNGVAKALSSISAEGLQNVSIHDDEVSTLLAVLPPASIGRVYILYPDPWPKSRHHKRRLISDDFLVRLARVMKNGAQLRFVTDIDDYTAWTLSRIKRSPDFTWLQKEPMEWIKPWEGWISTRYEQKAIEAARSPAYLIFQRI